ncbi:altronate dehydratase [Sulfurisphaera ohwakuensis]|uniref:Altronate dehydratase n=1 Tax=Sulfurisphaera ohwakuensis TaxID=69656 RepID=A0A7J9RUB2_SULOH|nr:altronate dehydratase [Sulfurisphaera ohwakuensis]
MEKVTIKGYIRENGSVGIRNHVAIIPVDDLSNSAAVAVSRIIRGTIALPHPYGRLQFGKDLDLLFHILSGTGANPNVAGAIVIGIEDNWAHKVADKIAETGKPVEVFPIEGNGDLRVIEKASRKAKEFVQYASEKQRTEVDLSSIVVSIKCGESDTTSGLASNPATGYAVDRLIDYEATVLFGETSELTGAEDIVANRIPDPALREKFMKIYKEYVSFIESQGASGIKTFPSKIKHSPHYLWKSKALLITR